MPTRRQTPRLPFIVTLAGLLASALAAGPVASAPPPTLTGVDHRELARSRVDRTFKVATLNILGSQHTRGWDRRRTFRTARLIRRQGINLIGMQEVQQDQLRWLQRELPRYRIWPAMRYDARGVRLQIGWRRSRFDQLDHGTITTVFSHQQRPIPWVRLREERTGRELYVIDIHNSPNSQERARDFATRKEIRLFKRLRSRRDGSVLIVGDANERREWFCKLTGSTSARAANGGSHTASGCEPPEPSYVDWLMGAGRFDWRRYEVRNVKVSDHRLHTAVVRWRVGR